MTRWLIIAVLLCAVASPTSAALLSERLPHGIKVKGEHFALTIDLSKGGEVSELKLNDGSQWNSVWTAPAVTFPMVKLSDAAHGYAAANADDARLTNLTETPEKLSLEISVVPRASDGTISPWQVTMTYEVYPEGAVFVDLNYELKTGQFALSNASVSFGVGDEIRKGPRYRDINTGPQVAGFRSARVAFGRNPARSFTNEIEVVVENRKAMSGSADFRQQNGRFTWTLGAGPATLTAPWSYRNRIAMGLGVGVNGRPGSNVIGQRVYHWVNFIDTTVWYPTDAQIDVMAANSATMLILHHEWMKQRGSNGHPHADYSVVRNQDEMVRTIARAHAKGMRVGLYMRGVEMYGPDTGFFQKYCKRDWDGIYADWHGGAARSYHDSKYKPETSLGDAHFSEAGTCIPARDYFLFSRRLREIVGSQGFLIGHQGTFCTGILSNLCFDAYLPGETGGDHDMFSSLDNAVYRGMMGGGVCMPWTLDSPTFRTTEGVAKMAAWGFYPHVVLGLKPPRTKEVFPCAPDDPMYAHLLSYWRVLAKADVENATVYNLPSQNLVALISSNPEIQGVVYKDGEGSYLIIVANLGSKPAAAELTLNTALLGMNGQYQVSAVDPATGQTHPHGDSSGTIATAKLPQWGIQGFTLTRSRSSR